jgi:FkbM family methyltransferase
MVNFSEQELLSFFPIENESPVLIDVGGHHGSVSRQFAKKGWQVIAFEPEPQNRSVFTRNLAGFPNVTCLPLAVSDVGDRKVPFYVSREHFGIHSLKPFHETHTQVIEVNTVRLNDVLDLFGICSVSLLKIDVEGADFNALKGIDLGLHRPELVMLEFMDERTVENFGYTHHDIVAYMKERGYSALVSEWAPIKEYGREGVPGEPHTWLQCLPYPLDHEPAWGNLIFVPEERFAVLTEALREYIRWLMVKINREAVLNA